MEAVVIERTGGPEVLTLREVPDPRPGPGEVLVRVTAAGINFIDTYHRTGLYPLDLPFVPGLEGAGEVVAVGEGVSELAVGDRVAWQDVRGSYAPLLAVPAGRAVPIPDGVSDEQAAAVLLQGVTAHYLVFDTFPLQAGQRCLIHAAAGGVGRLLVQMAKRIGAEVFATAGGAEKCQLAASAGADHVIDYRERDFAAAVEEIAGPRPLHVVYDGVGKATFEGGLSLLRPRGMMVTFGNASGPPDPVSPLQLMREGSLYLTRPTLFHYASTTAELRARAAHVFQMVSEGLEVLVGLRLPLREAAAAHRALEGRETVGKVLLVP